jgi:hypothetical protein
VSSLLSSIDFFRVDAEITYPCAGSFVRYLIDQYGLGPFKRYLASATFDDSAAVTVSRVQAAYDRPVTALWEEWLARIR